MLWGPVSPVWASILSVSITWAFFCIGEILLLVNLFRVFLVMMVNLEEYLHNQKVLGAVHILRQPGEGGGTMG